jgi:hypothetical protein
VNHRASQCYVPLHGVQAAGRVHAACGGKPLGRSVIVAISTNEDLARLHPATVRPSRCLAQIEVGPMTRAEAATWLGRSDGIGAYGATLAELYALREGEPAAPAERPATGMYL